MDRQLEWSLCQWPTALNCLWQLARSSLGRSHLYGIISELSVLKGICQPYALLISKSQKLCVTPLGMFINWISPVYKLVFVPPSVIIPPGSSTCAVGSLTNLVNQNDISGEAHMPLFARACQKGKALVEARAWNASPMMPATVPDSRELVVCCTSTKTPLPTSMAR